MARPSAERRDIVANLAEVFREHGYEGASLSLIGEATGLGKGSLYHFFPGGKEDMARAVLTDIDGWFEEAIFAPLRGTGPPAARLDAMFAGIDAYFGSGRRACLIGGFALGRTRERFAGVIDGYFRRWQRALARALVDGGAAQAGAEQVAEEVIAGLQGALILALARQDSGVFARQSERLAARCSAALAGSPARLAQDGEI